jgi:hypothetical protein
MRYTESASTLFTQINIEREGAVWRYCYRYGSELLFSLEKRAMLKDVVFGVVGSLELFPVSMLNSDCFCNAAILEAIVDAVERDFERGKLRPRGGHGVLSARVILSNSVMIVAENLIRWRRKAMALTISGENGDTSKESAKRSNLYTFLVSRFCLENLSIARSVITSRTIFQVRNCQT